LLYEATSENSIIKVADFGVSRVLKTSDETMSTVIGTSNYLAPEIISGKLYTLKCDVYALGTILYILLCGYPPFDDEENPNFYNDVVKGNLRFPSPEWDNITTEGWIISQKFD
jgi:serine/threonine protein kinase